VDPVEGFFKGLTWVSLASFLYSALVLRSCEAALYSGLVLALSIAAVHERRLRRVEGRG
jgi:hypothetical protein